jgi:hypothetical protein
MIGERVNWFLFVTGWKVGVSTFCLWHVGPQFTTGAISHRLFEPSAMRFPPE